MNEFSLFPITFSIIAFTVVVSFLAFNNQETKYKLLFYPSGMTSSSEYYRFISHGFVHADYIHLFFNMYTLYSFGRVVESSLFNKTEYLVFYLTALVASSIFDFFKQKDNTSYAALGASGAVSAVVFSTIIFGPWDIGVLLFGIVPLPNIVFAGAYLFYCYYMNKKGTDNIGHSAHMWGSIYGFAFTALLRPELLKSFLVKLMHPSFL
jgi:membrane associated rhomboid family serine protease